MRAYLLTDDNGIGTFRSPRPFRLWHLTVSHLTLLLRSPRDTTNPQSENLDLVFHATDYIELPSSLNGLAITRPTAAERAYLQGRGAFYETPDLDRYFVLVSAGQRYYIVASELWICYNHLGPLQHPDVDSEPPTTPGA